MSRSSTPLIAKTQITLGLLLLELAGLLALLTAGPAAAEPAALASWPIALHSGGAQPATWNFSNALGIDPATNAAQPGRAGLALQDAVFDSAPSLYALDAALVVTVDGAQFVAPDTVTATAQSVATGEVDLAGLRAAVDYTALAQRATLRTVISLRNPQAGPVTVAVSFASNVSAGLNAQTSTASGAGFSPGDRWVNVGDTSTTPAPDVLTVLYGPLNPPAPAAVALTVFEDQGPEGVAVTYTVSIPPAATRRLLFFTELSPAGSGPAAADAYSVTDETGELFAGLASQELHEIVNWFGYRMYLPSLGR